MFARDPEFEVLGETADRTEAVRLALALVPDVILMGPCGCRAWTA
jgi:chemotaxis response regulator CheB